LAARQAQPTRPALSKRGDIAEATGFDAMGFDATGFDAMGFDATGFDATG